MTTFGVSGRCHALRPNNEVVAGPRVDLAHVDLFFADLGRSIAKTPVDNSTDGVEFVFTNSAVVGCGVGKRSGRPEDYVLASVDGIVEACLKREYAASATRYFVRVVRKAPYLRDQYALNHIDEFDRVANESCEFVITEVTTDRDKEYKTLRAKLREAAKSYGDTPCWEIEDMLDKDLLWVTVAG